MKVSDLPSVSAEGRRQRWRPRWTDGYSFESKSKRTAVHASLPSLTNHLYTLICLIKSDLIYYNYLLGQCEIVKLVAY